MPRKPKNFGSFTFEQAVGWYRQNNVAIPKSYRPGGRYYKAAQKYGDITIDELRGHGKPAGIWSTVNHLGKLGEHQAANAKEASKLGRFYNEARHLFELQATQDKQARREKQRQLREWKYPATWGEFRKKWKDRKIILYDRDGNKVEFRPLSDPDMIFDLYQKDMWPTKEKGKFSSKGWSAA